MFKSLFTTILVFSMLGASIMEKPVLASTYNPETKVETFKNIMKSINADRDPVAKSVTTIETAGQSLGNIAWSPDSQYLAVMETKKKEDGISVVVISLDKNRVIKELPLYKNHTALREPIAFSPDGKYLAAAVNGVIRLWDTKTWTVIRDIEGATEEDPYTPFGPVSLVFSPDSQNLTCLFDTAFWWPPSEKRRTRAALEEWEKKTDKSKLNRTFWKDLNAGSIGEHARTIVVFKVPTDEKLFYWRTPRDTALNIQVMDSNLDYSTDGKYLLVAVRELKRKSPQDSYGIYYARLQLHNPKTGKIINEMSIASAQNEIIALRAVNGHLFTASKHQDTPSPGMPMLATDPVRLWNEDFTSPVKEFKVNLKMVKNISVSQDGKILIVFDGLSAEIWDVERQELMRQLIVNDSSANDCLISPNGKTLASVDMDKHLVQLIRLKTPLR